VSADRAMPRDVACAILYRNGQILLGKRSPHRRLYPNCWDVIGGHVEAGETVAQALLREVEGEIALLPARYHAIDPMTAENGQAIHHLFIISEWHGGEPAMRGDEHSELRWFSLSRHLSRDTIRIHVSS
jgi:8-oxo-dGTP pyrophosphatase MutT (NUDIX family)